MNHSRRNRIFAAYALLFLVSASIIILDPVQRRAASGPADVRIPTPKAFKVSSVPGIKAEKSSLERLAGR